MYDYCVKYEFECMLLICYARSGPLIRFNKEFEFEFIEQTLKMREHHTNAEAHINMILSMPWHKCVDRIEDHTNQTINVLHIIPI